MPQFVYTAKEGPHKIINGTVAADNQEGAVSKIVQLGLSPLEVAPVTERLQVEQKILAKGSTTRRKVKLKSLVVFTLQLSDLMDASVPVLKAFELIARQTQDRHLRERVEAIYANIQDGGSLSSALAEHADVFSALYINMVRTGEASGKLAVVLNRLAQYLQKEQETRSKVIASLAYPLFILVVGVISVFVLVTFVVPKITVMFEDLGQELPWPTQVLMAISALFSDSWWIILPAVAMGLLALMRWLQSPAGKNWADEKILQLPLIGGYVRMVETGRFARAFATLLESGVDAHSALRTVVPTIENTALRLEIDHAQDQVAQGMSLKEALGQCPSFPEMAVNMIAVGEETGNLHVGLNKVADSFERQSNEINRASISLLGPVVLFVVVGIVFFIVVAMMLPLVNLNLGIE